uniref:Uncharacterized protein n=1 Tax=Mycena chlorophos TaxID=658473 RepID=A0ABQ0M4Q3_MYCCL|nr:predicted protein [Mycena chlorophos]
MSSSQPSDVPPFYGAVETTMNALRLIHAARQGIIPRITRRLNDAERRSMIKSGAVFVFSVEESGIKRWTDGLLWSPSRIVGNFLVYREINERTNSRGSQKRLYPSDESSRALSAGEHGTFKTNGLIKKTITVTIEGSDLHLISYYTAADQHSGKLKRPTCRPDIMALTMDPRLFRATNFRVPPKTEKLQDGSQRLVENEEPDAPAIECKVEEEAYNIPMSSAPGWGSDNNSSPSPIESPFGSNSALFPLTPHNNAYSRHGDRWVGSPTLRTSEASGSWSPHHYGSSGRRDSDNWGLSAARWNGAEYGQSTSYDRSRSRAGNPYPPPLHTTMSRRDVGSHHSAPDSRNARLPWLLTDKTDPVPARPASQASSFSSPTPAPQIFNNQGYMRSHGHSQSYGSPNSWSHSSNPASSSSGSPGSLSAMASPQTPFSPPPASIHSYGSGSSYAPSSGGLSSPEEYSSNGDAGDYGDA